MVRPQFPPKLSCSEFANCRVEPGAEFNHEIGLEEYLHPRFMAEELCTDALVASIRERRSRSQLQAAWSGVEMALSMPERPVDAEAFFDYAEDTFQAMFMYSDKEFHQINASIGLAFMPAYRARYRHSPLGRRGIESIHREIASMLGTFDATYDPGGKDKFAGIKPELVTLALFARLQSFEWLAYPASPREENTDIAEFNHDSYVIREDIKVPIQVKRKGGSGYDPTVAMVSLRDILARVNEHRRRYTTQVWGNKRKATRPLRPLDSDDFASLIVREAGGEWLNEHETWLLELASMAAINEVLKKETIILNQQREALQNRGRIALAA